MHPHLVLSCWLVMSATRICLDRALTGIEAVVHLAAKVGLGVSVADLPDYASSNDVGTSELLAGMARRGVGRLTLASWAMSGTSRRTPPGCAVS